MRPVRFYGSEGAVFGVWSGWFFPRGYSLGGYGPGDYAEKALPPSLCEQIDRRLRKHYLHETSFAGGSNR